MNKIIKLIFLAALLIGAVIGLVYVIAPDNGEDTGPDVTSAQAIEWKNQINKLCEEGNWNVKGYTTIETGIHTDRVTSNGDLLSLDEENALQKYLFTASCKNLNKEVNELFKQSNYPAQSVKSSEEMLRFLNGKLESFGSNSNLSEASNILSEYHQLMGALSFSGSASYSRPLRAFSAISADAAKSRINRLKYYKSHFSKNSSIRSRVDNLASDRVEAEAEYYANLERAVENHFKSTNDWDALLEDQIRFYQISTNTSAKSRLDSFVKNPYK